MTRKPAKRYHHGDLRRALVEQAVATIQKDGVDALTLRAVGAKLGVSRTALYRHFADKGALLAAVAREGFREFHRALSTAVDTHSDAQAGFAAMGRAYVRFAVDHPSHYRVMFGGFVEACDRDPELVAEAQASFGVLVDAIRSMQQRGLVQAGDPVPMARYVWAVSHGVAMLAIDGQLRDLSADEEMNYAIDRIATGIAVPTATQP